MSEYIQGCMRCGPEDLQNALPIHTRKITDSCRFQDRLGASGQVDPQRLDAVLIPAAVRNFSGVNRECLAGILRHTAQALTAMISHGITSR